jgi:hypothetical protein
MEKQPERIEYLPLEAFLDYKRSVDEPLTPEEQIERLHREYPMFKRQVIKAILGFATEEDIQVLKEEQEKLREAIVQGGYKLEDGKWIRDDDLDNFVCNKASDYEPSTLSEPGPDTECSECSSNDC